MNKAQLIKDSLKEAGEHYTKLHSLSGLKCPEGCGKCCFNPNVYCRPSELLPMAWEYIRLGEAENMLEKVNALLESSAQDQICLVLNIKDESKFLGNCSMYEYRPLLCRSFGVFLRKNRDEKREFSLCREFKELYPDEVKELGNQIEQFKEHPTVDKISYGFYNSNADLIYENEMQINKALKWALERALFLYSLQEKNT